MVFGGCAGRGVSTRACVLRLANRPVIAVFLAKPKLSRGRKDEHRLLRAAALPLTSTSGFCVYVGGHGSTQLAFRIARSLRASMLIDLNARLRSHRFALERRASIRV